MTQQDYPEPAELASGTAPVSPGGATSSANLDGSRAFTDADVTELALALAGNVYMSIGWLTGAFPPEGVEHQIKAHLTAALRNCQMHSDATQTHLHIAAVEARKRYEAAANTEGWE